MSVRTVSAGGIPVGREFRSISMDLHPRTFQRLRALKERLEAVSYAEVVKTALRALEVSLDADDRANSGEKPAEAS